MADFFNDVFQRSIARINSVEGRPSYLFPQFARLDRSCLLTCINLLSKKPYDSLIIIDDKWNELPEAAKEALYRELNEVE